MKKAFDCCNLDILLKKLNHYGFKNVANTWFKNYLVNRTQYVCINGAFPTERIITCGIPQGSVLGPLATSFFIRLFADGTSFLKSSPDIACLMQTHTELKKAAK